MPEVLMIQGKPETIFDNEQFARLLDERLGYEAAEYFRNAVHDANRNPAKEVCMGECDAVYRVQEHFERIIRDVADEMCYWAIHKLTKAEIVERRNNAVKRLRDGLKDVGSE